MRKRRVEIDEKIINYFLNSTETNIGTSTIAKKIGSNFPTTNKFLKRMSKMTLLNEIVTDGKVLGFSLNIELLGVLMETDFYKEDFEKNWQRGVLNKIDDANQKSNEVKDGK